jgi:hypothetical protein
MSEPGDPEAAGVLRVAWAVLRRGGRILLARRAAGAGLDRRIEGLLERVACSRDDDSPLAAVGLQPARTLEGVELA